MQTKEHTFHGKSTAEWARLRRLQTDLEAETGNACFLGLSMADTLRQCISLGNHRAAGRVRTEFKISDRRFWWIKVTNSHCHPKASCLYMEVHLTWKTRQVIHYVCSRACAIICGICGPFAALPDGGGSLSSEMQSVPYPGRSLIYR